MAVTIPITRAVDDTGYFDLQVNLDGVTYTLEFRWNVRLGAWFMNVFDIDGTTAYQVGVRLVVDNPLSPNIVDRIPSGVFVAVDTGSPLGGGQDPNFDDLGSRVQLTYYPLSDLV